MAVEIRLTQGFVALVDDADEAVAREHRWWVLHSGRGAATIHYARAARKDPKAGALLHKFLTGWPMVDHINGDGLDNRRANLRLCTRSQNMGNRRKYTVGQSLYKGVHPLPGGRRWQALVGFGGRKSHLGCYATEVEAALAYDKAARQLWGEFAALNFPEPGERSALAYLDSDGAILGAA